MSEPISRISRRDFLKAAGIAVLAGTALAQPTTRRLLRSNELLSRNVVRLGALRTSLIQGEEETSKSLRVLNEVGKALNSEHLDLLITPEYSFHTHWSVNDEGMPLTLNQVNENVFEIDKPQTDEFTQFVVEEGVKMAKHYRSNLLLSTFYDLEGKGKTSAIFINSDGIITGLKRKFEPPVGSFNINRGQHSLKILPLICGEVWEKRTNDPITDDWQSVPPQWVRDGAPFDILTHSLSQADVDFNGLVKFVQGEVGVPDDELYQIDRVLLEGAFKDYYGEYLQYLKPNAPIILADVSMAGAFNANLEEMKNFSDSGNYVAVEIPTNY